MAKATSDSRYLKIRTNLAAVRPPPGLSWDQLKEGLSKQVPTPFKKDEKATLQTVEWGTLLRLLAAEDPRSGKIRTLIKHGPPLRLVNRQTTAAASGQQSAQVSAGSMRPPGLPTAASAPPTGSGEA